MLNLEDIIKAAFTEDVGDGDHTSFATINAGSMADALVKIKEDGIVSGIEVAKKTIEIADKSIQVTSRFSDGTKVKVGDVVMSLNGNTLSLLKIERLLLNCMQRMSGIASLTGKYVEAVNGTGVKILDTRKTTPNFRVFEKMAVRHGGGFNHRFGLYDMILIKDNHVDAAGGISNALLKTKDYLEKTGRKLNVEIETRTIEEVKEVIDTGVANRIMLDNFPPEKLKEAVALIGSGFETEASGGITLKNILAYANTGVNFISVGALTHSYSSLDISMKLSAIKIT